MRPFEISALGITAVMLVTWLLAVRQIMTAGSFPSLVHGSLRVSSGGMRLAWVLVLLFALGLGGPTVAREDESTLPVRVARPDFWEVSDLVRRSQPLADRVVNGRGSAIRFGSFGKATYSWQLRTGEAVSYSITELRLPLYFPLALLFYWLGVARRQAAALEEERVVLP